MAAEPTMLKRSELYAPVWEKATQNVAADIGVSGVGLAKACKRHLIPVPERGYWRRKEWGYQVRQQPLPSLPDGADPTIAFHASTNPETAAEPATPEDEFEQRPENRVIVSETLDRFARAGKHTRATLRERKPDDSGLVRTWAKHCFRVEVAPGSLDRAVRLLQTLVDAFGARGYELLDGDDSGSGIRVKVKGEVLSMRLVERVKQVPHVVTEREEIRHELNPGWKAPRLDTVPTGTLILRIQDAPGPLQHGVFRDRVTVELEEGGARGPRGPTEEVGGGREGPSGEAADGRSRGSAVPPNRLEAYLATCQTVIAECDSLAEHLKEPREPIALKRTSGARRSQQSASG